MLKTDIINRCGESNRHKLERRAGPGTIVGGAGQLQIALVNKSEGKPANSISEDLLEKLLYSFNNVLNTQMATNNLVKAVAPLGSGTVSKDTPIYSLGLAFAKGSHVASWYVFGQTAGSMKAFQEMLTKALLESGVGRGNVAFDICIKGSSEVVATFAGVASQVL